MKRNHQYELTEILVKTTDEIKIKPYPNVKVRALDRIGNLPVRITRNIETYHEFKMYNCKNQEIQFLSLVKRYNRLFGEGNPSDNHKTNDFKKINITEGVKKYKPWLSNLRFSYH